MVLGLHPDLFISYSILKFNTFLNIVNLNSPRIRLDTLERQDRHSCVFEQSQQSPPLVRVCLWRPIPQWLIVVFFCFITLEKYKYCLMTFRSWDFDHAFIFFSLKLNYQISSTSNQSWMCPLFFKKSVLNSKCCTFSLRLH